jgi:hypothetical protein
MKTNLFLMYFSTLNSNAIRNAQSRKFCATTFLCEILTNLVFVSLPVFFNIAETHSVGMKT